jgi:hypothetical protein
MHEVEECHRQLQDRSLSARLNPRSDVVTDEMGYGIIRRDVVECGKNGR